MTFDEWFQYGFDNKWCSRIVCSSHDVVPMSEQELNEWQEGSDRCFHAVRLYESSEQFDAAERIV